MKYSCVVPVYNESSRVGKVLDALKEVNEISEIIIVDDGSTDDSVKVIKKFYPKLTLIQLKVNQGKVFAVKAGVKAAKYEGILLIDSDLSNLKKDEITKGIHLFEDNDLDCLLLSTYPMSKIDLILRYIFRAMLCAAGNRIIYKGYLQEVFKMDITKSYHLEIATNKYLMDNHKKVAYMDISAVNLTKASKDGFIKGLIKEIEMWRQIVSYAGLVFFLKQSFLFSRDKVAD